MRTISTSQKTQVIEHAGFQSERRVTAQIVNYLVIDGYGTVTNQCFIEQLVKNNRLPFSALKTKRIMLTSEYATRLLNENSDLFPKEF